MPIPKQSAHPRAQTKSVIVCGGETFHTPSDGHRLTAGSRIVDERHNYLNTSFLVWELISKRRRTDPHAFKNDVA